MRITLALIAVAALLPAQGTLKIVVKWDGDAPKPKALVLPADFVKRNPDEAAFCDACAKKGKLLDETLVVDPKTKGIRDVAISLDGPRSSRDQLPPQVTLDNEHCRFSPRVAWVPIGSPLIVKNSDKFTHNARISARGRRQFWNALVPGGASVNTYPVTIGGVYRVVCDVHPWMKAWVIGTRNHWVGVTPKSGVVQFKDVSSPRPVKVHLWHPHLGRARVRVEVERGKEVLKSLTQKDFKKL
ncbi:MAG: hypothetical protein CMJ83_13515 [Planctomycetes bacterium]|nr:hypothetical protein [Planctomycetota bacterium]